MERKILNSVIDSDGNGDCGVYTLLGILRIKVSSSLIIKVRTEIVANMINFIETNDVGYSEEK